MKKVLTTRVPKELVKRLEKVTEALHTDKAALLRTFIVKGVTETERELVLEQYQRGEISLGKVSDLLHLSRWDVLSLLAEENRFLQYGEKELEEDLHALR